MGRRAAAWLLLAALAAPSPASAQPAPLEVYLPPSLILPNYDRVQIGQREGIEANAYVARTDDAVAAWYNPAGLVRSDQTALAASANAYEWMSLSIEGGARTTGRSAFSSVNALVAALIGNPIIGNERLRLGVSYATPINWEPAAIDFAFTQPQGAGTEVFSAFSSSKLRQSHPALSAGYEIREGLRVGATISMPWTSVYQNQVITNHYVSGDSIISLSRNFATEGSVAQMQFGGGLQWDFASRWTLGATVTSPGMRLFGSALVRYDLTVAGDGDNGFIALRDDEARLEYKNPLKVTGGVAYKLDRGSIEADVRYYGEVGKYAMFSSDVVGAASADTIGGASVFARPVSLLDSPNDVRAVINVSVGGRYDLTPDWTLNLGFYTDNSPVADQSQSILRKIDMWGVTAGSEVAIGRLSGALGVAYSTGQSTSAPLGTILGGRILETKVKVSSFRINYAVSYKF